MLILGTLYPPWVLYSHVRLTWFYGIRSLENTIKKHATPNTSAFSGKGQTLGGPSTPSETVNPTPQGGVLGGITNIDPQVKLFVGLIAVYIFMWWFK